MTASEQPADLSASIEYARVMGRIVAMGWLEDGAGAGCVALHVVQRHRGDPGISGHVKFCLWMMRNEAERIERERASAEYRVRRQVWPLCREDRPGREILAAAQKVADRPPDKGQLYPDEVLAICREVARSAKPRRRSRRGPYARA